MNCAAPSLMKTLTPLGASGTFLTVTDPTMKLIASVSLALIVGVFAADYIRQGAVAGVALHQQHLCR